MRNLEAEPNFSKKASMRTFLSVPRRFELDVELAASRVEDLVSKFSAASRHVRAVSELQHNFVERATACRVAFEHIHVDEMHADLLPGRSVDGPVAEVARRDDLRVVGRDDVVIREPVGDSAGGVMLLWLDGRQRQQSAQQQGLHDAVGADAGRETGMADSGRGVLLRAGSDGLVISPEGDHQSG